jgi:hypothetical protein
MRILKRSRSTVRRRKRDKDRLERMQSRTEIKRPIHGQGGVMLDADGKPMMVAVTHTAMIPDEFEPEGLAMALILKHKKSGKTVVSVSAPQGQDGLFAMHSLFMSGVRTCMNLVADLMNKQAKPGIEVVGALPTGLPSFDDLKKAAGIRDA